MLRLHWMLIAVLIGMMDGQGQVAHGQPPGCIWPADAVFHATNPNNDFVAWSDGGSIYWLRCSDGVLIRMDVGQMPTALYFDGLWLPYILHYSLTDGSHWQISVVDPPNLSQISPPINPAVTDTPGEAHGSEATSSPPTATPDVVSGPPAVSRHPYPFIFRLRFTFRGWF